MPSGTAIRRGPWLRGESESSIQGRHSLVVQPIRPINIPVDDGAVVQRGNVRAGLVRVERPNDVAGIDTVKYNVANVYTLKHDFTAISETLIEPGLWKGPRI